MKVNIDELNRSMDKVMHALNNLVARQDKDHRDSLKESAPTKTIGTPMDKKTMPGFIHGCKSGEANVTQQEENLPPPEGFIPYPMKNGIPHALQTPVIILPVNENFVDLGS